MAATDYQVSRFPLGIAEMPVKNTSGTIVSRASWRASSPSRRGRAPTGSWSPTTTLR